MTETHNEYAPPDAPSLIGQGSARRHHARWRAGTSTGLDWYIRWYNKYKSFLTYYAAMPSYPLAGLTKPPTGGVVHKFAVAALERKRSAGQRRRVMMSLAAIGVILLAAAAALSGA
jgi:hypothetical protein